MAPPSETEQAKRRDALFDLLQAELERLRLEAAIARDGLLTRDELSATWDVHDFTV